MKNNNSQIPIAIIGIGCIFAKSPDLKGYLRLLMGSINGITDPPPTHQQLYDCFDPDPKKRDHIYCNRGGYLPQVAFDPTEFGIPPHNLEATDTSQLLGLLVAKQALNDAGYGEGGKQWDRSNCSVIIGVTGTQELVIPLGARLGHPLWRKALSQSGVSPDRAEVVIDNIADSMVEWQENSFPGLLGNVVAGRIANRLDLGGTNCVVDAACASSMGAITMSIMELASGNSDMVITGGVDTINDAFMHMCFSKTQILSPTGDIRPFSEDADGTVLGEGIGLLVLKRLADAERDQDRIYAVIRGIGSSSDGKSQSIYAPRLEGQASALNRAYSQAGVIPDNVELVEAHGTGTRVGDQVEFSSLCQVFGSAGQRARPCALGSVKSNIGHTKAAAGTAGLIKSALALYHKMLPPTLKADHPDPKLPLQGSRFYLNNRLRPWIRVNNRKRIAGVSSFGFGGSNFHAVMEEYHFRKEEPTWNGQVDMAAFSAPDRSTLGKQLDQWNAFLKKEPFPEARSLRAAQTRAAFNCDDAMRMVLVFDLFPDDTSTHPQDHVLNQSLTAAESLSGMKPDQRTLFIDNCFIGQGGSPGPVACLFPGQGSQYPGMGRDIVCCFPESLDVFEKADFHFDGSLPLSAYVYPLGNKKPEDSEARLKETRIAQPALGAVSLAMFEALKSFGLKPVATCGHSYGELVALHAAGWISDDDFWRLSIERGRLMAEAGRRTGESGTMLAVIAPLDDIKTMVAKMAPDVILANLNSPSQGVLSGSREAIQKARDRCSRKGWRTVPLNVSAAFHSSFVAEAQKPFQNWVNDISFTPGDIQVVSNTSGGTYPPTQKDARNLLGRQLANPVDFISNIETLYQQGIRTFIEVGPKSVLKSLVESILKEQDIHAFSMDRSAGRNHGLVDFAYLLGSLAVLGHDIRLERWEKPVSPRRQARMSVMLSGANYRTPKKQVAKASVAAKPPVASQQAAVSPAGPKPVQANAREHVDPPPSRRTGNFAENTESINFQPHQNIPLGDARKMDRTTKQHLQTSLNAIQQGLSSVIELQRKTAEAHQKFLESQTQAGKTLMHIMQQAHQLSAAAMGASPAPMPAIKEMPGTVTRATPQVAKAVPSPHTEPAKQSPAVHNKPVPTAPIARPAPESIVIQTVQAPAPATSPVVDVDIQTPLLAVVSELTGYPEEMLGLEMDIESDLGIDSIKRVEILSALEERMPDLPKVTPDMMGTLKTLGQICDYLGSAAAPASEPASAPPPAREATPAPTTASGADADQVRQTLLAVVSELTGYPEEMLGLEMDIESDLGIDSIKRVEILSALEERMPDLPKVTPDMMGTLKTLGQICDYLGSAAAPASEPASAPPPAREATPAPTTTSGADADQVRQTLLAVVSELTGYPEEMLGLEMDIESDLGIDSIKRVEILSALEERMPDLPKVTPDMMGTLKTLGQIGAFLSGSDGDAPPAETIHGTETTGDSSPAEKIADPAGEATDIPRSVVRITPMSNGGDTVQAASNAPPVGIVCRRAELAQAISEHLAHHGFKGILLSKPKDVLNLDSLSGVLISAPVSPKQALEWVQVCQPALNVKDAASPFLFTLSFLDGAFGFKGKDIADPYQGALSGLVKTAALEWPAVRCAAIDVNPTWDDMDQIGKAVVSEMVTPDPHMPLEIGLSGPSERIVLELVTAPAISAGALELDQRDVVVVTGGARGVTAACALALARKTGCPLAMLGRSPQPGLEPPWLSGLESEAEMKRAILENQFKGKPVTPKDIESAYRKWSGNREITRMLASLNGLGVNAQYYSVDVRDPDAMAFCLNDVRSELGDIKGLIHGAGVLEDRLIIDKEAAQLQRVFDTKVKGLEVLLTALEKDDLKHIVCFSSVAARMGNIGQVDYAMANEVLNKMAVKQQSVRPGCKVLSINWGPWDGGMVTLALKRNFQKHQINLIPIAQGAEAMVAEMSKGSKNEVEVVIGGLFHHPLSDESRPETNGKGMSLTAKRDIDIDNYPILKSHLLNGKPVVPLALMTEWLAHSALLANPGLVFTGIENLRLFKGIVLDQPQKNIRLMAGKLQRAINNYEVDVEIRNGVVEGHEVVHSGAKAILSDRIPIPPDFKDNGYFKETAGVISPADAYKNILFHGEGLRGIEEIIRISDQGMTARIAVAPHPETWVREPFRNHWIVDPLILDCAFQMGILWCHQQFNQVSLPSFAAAYRQYCEKFPETGVTAVLEVQNATTHKMIGCYTFLDRENRVLAQLEGYEAIMDQNLIHKFHPN